LKEGENSGGEAPKIKPISLHMLEQGGMRWGQHTAIKGALQGQERMCHMFHHSAWSTSLNCVEHAMQTSTSLRLK